MDTSLKQRLVGAAVLVALAVIFLPLLVKGPAPDSGVSDVSLRVPPEPKAPDGTVTQDLPLVAPAAAPTGGVSGMPSAMPAASEAPAADAAPLAAVAAGDFAVSFGNYASSADADKVIAALAAAGLPGYREAVALGDRQAQRVRIGPFADRATAESARLRAGQVRSDVDAKVLALDAAATAAPAAPAPPAATKPASAEPKIETKPLAKVEPVKTEPAKPATAPAAKPEPLPAKPANPAGTGFVVQIGAFSSAPDALAQRDALRKAGFNAFTDSVPGPNGTLTRVRVGPVMTRAEADALKAKLKAAGKDGMVRPHP
ncbi:SPOR domain-containing protein [Thermomonas fusca]|uniref:SPOR domain-containing protein n=1 Tax=Thermomonas fusca TaxID=215690 RepID=A0A5R9PEM5_9GAMM|nr:SPOR domain-containing protein [Thermomonas fusca]TLX21696.1 SPOR domain-containing protein [Thermomonas fusca]